MEKRAAIRAKEEVTLWSSYKGRTGIWTKIPEATRQAVLDWIYKHPDVIPSPLGSDTLLVQDPDNLEDPKAKIRKNKVLLQCSIRELHNDLYSSKIGLDPAKLYKNGEPLISDTAFWALLPPEMRKITDRYKMMCCCEDCMLAHYYQSALN